MHTYEHSVFVTWTKTKSKCQLTIRISFNFLNTLWMSFSFVFVFVVVSAFGNIFVVRRLVFCFMSWILYASHVCVCVCIFWGDTFSQAFRLQRHFISCCQALRLLLCHHLHRLWKEGFLLVCAAKLPNAIWTLEWHGMAWHERCNWCQMASGLTLDGRNCLYLDIVEQYTRTHTAPIRKMGFHLVD